MAMDIVCASSWHVDDWNTCNICKYMNVAIWVTCVTYFHIFGGCMIVFIQYNLISIDIFAMSPVDVN